MPDDIPQTDITITCPHCGVCKQASYAPTDKRPVLYGQCTFCGTLYKWTKSKTIIITPAERTHTIIIKMSA